MRVWEMCGPAPPASEEPALARGGRHEGAPTVNLRRSTGMPGRAAIDVDAATPRGSPIVNDLPSPAVGAASCRPPAGPTSPYHQPIFSTGLAENFVMQELVAAGEQPYYWGMKSKHEAQFVLETDDGAVPIDVTPTRKRTRATAACDFARRYASPYVLQVSNRNIDRTRRDNREIRIIPPYALSQVVA